MKTRAICLPLFLLSGVLANPAASAGNSPVAPPATTTLMMTVKTPLLRIGGLPAVAVSINGSKPYPFVVDWAANLLAISPARARALRLTSLGTDEMGNPMVAVADLAIGQARFKGLTAAADPFLDGHEESGVLGVNVYRHTTFTIDFGRNIITIDSRGLPPANGRDVLAYRPSPGGAPMVSVTICAIRVWANIDTAAAASIRLPASMMNKLGCTYHIVSSGNVMGAQSGQSSVTDARVAGNVSIGSLTFKQPIIRFGEGSSILVGDGVLNGLVISLDQEHQLIRIIRP